MPVYSFRPVSPVQKFACLFAALLLTACSGSGGDSTTGSELGPGFDDNASVNGAPAAGDAGVPVTPMDNALNAPVPNDSNVPVTTSAMNPGDDAQTTPSATAPRVDAAGQVTWSFAPQLSSVELELMEFTEMPLADSGRPARWNSMAHADDRLFVSNEKDGRIFEITGRDTSLWFDVATAVQTWTGRNLNTDNPFHGGVRGFAFHPNFSVNGKFYVSMMQDRPSDPSGFHYLSDASGDVEADSVLVEWSANPSTFAVDMNSYREVFRVGIPEYDHPIKQIGFNPVAQPGQEDFGLLYVAHGDGSRESSIVASGEQNNALGKILRINPLQNGTRSYSVPSSNPFVGSNAMLDEVYSLGHRNPHHLAFLPDGSLLATESGRDNIDEINLVTKGANYGWSQREGAYVNLGTGNLADGIQTLPANDAALGLTYPVVQFGHTGFVGDSFVGQGLGGGFAINNGSDLDGEFFYVEFVTSGQLFHSSMRSILASETEGDPAELTMAQTFETRIVFDHDGNPDTAAISYTIPELLQSSGNYDGSGRVDIRIGQGPLGEMYLMNKRNNMIYLVRNSYPLDLAIPAAPSASQVNASTTTDIPELTRINFDITVPAYVSNALQVRLMWGDKDLLAGWVTDESWAISDDFPTATENRLVVTFNDNNGEITLGSFETNLRTGTGATETIVITADQFDTMMWDNDSDGVSNFEELTAGTDPLASNAIEPTTFASLSDVFDRCDGCHDDTPRGNLSLLPDRAYSELVGQPSAQKEGAIRVIPFDPDNSYLIQKMEGAQGIVGSSMSYGGPTFAQRVRAWIAQGALNN